MRAQFYLESSGWQLQIALASFYEEDDGAMDVVEVPATEARSSLDIVDVTPPISSPSVNAPPPKASSSRVVTVSDMKKNQNNEEEEEGQRFYAGGSDHSGQQVVGPKKKKTSEIVDNLFKKAKEHGAEEVSSGSDPIQPSKPRNFAGVGYRLGDTEDEPSQTVQGGSVRKEQTDMHCRIKLWKNGFSVNDEELRDYKDPTNSAFLGSISRGEIPRELLQQARGGEVHLDMEDHREEEYTAPKPKVKAFSGTGHMLGSPAPTVVSSAKPVAAAASSGSLGQQTIQVDTSQPQTNIQLRLADGSRLVGKFNHSHTLADIRNFIVAKISGKKKQSLKKIVGGKTKKESPEKVPERKLENSSFKRRSWTMQEKVDIIQWHRENKSSQSSTAMLFGCDRKRIREWDRNYEELLLLSSTSGLSKKKKMHSGKKPLSYELDYKLLLFLDQQRKRRIQVTNIMLQSKACELANQLNIYNFNASSGWLSRWKKRSNVAIQLGTNEHFCNDSQQQMIQFQKEIINKRKEHDIKNFHILTMHQIVVRFDSTSDIIHVSKEKVMHGPPTDISGKELIQVPHMNDSREELLQGSSTNISEEELVRMPLMNDSREEFFQGSPTNVSEEELVQMPLTNDCREELIHGPPTNVSVQMSLTNDCREELILRPPTNAVGEKLIQVPTTGDTGESLLWKRGFTVCFCVCADGHKLPACIVFKKQNGDISPPVKSPFCMPVNIRVGASSNGRMHGQWLGSILNVLRDFDETDPLLLILNRHNTYNFTKTCEILKKLNIETVCIPGACTNVSQWIDACINVPFKKKFYELWKAWLSTNKERTFDGSLKAPSRYQVINWISEAWESISEKELSQVFLRCGISNALDGSQNSEIKGCSELTLPKKELENDLTWVVFNDECEDAVIEFEGFGDEDDDYDI
ncbi:uncharacterized protein LOC117112790 [Anneissia japonica]|uniref:uncharacterized protein LOC117112790 n=1 Tax=Anneissia japonica TaxID=1529436 RepID=UPI001425A4FD|nr:uncharacterized protein LOC117112790 [Anneissia japonica]